MVKKKRRGKPTLRHFRRELTNLERSILVIAGGGDPAEGWRTLCDVYRAAHAAGWRYGMPFDTIKVTSGPSE
jgi:hypothetical protein